MSTSEPPLDREADPEWMHERGHQRSMATIVKVGVVVALLVAGIGLTTWRSAPRQVASVSGVEQGVTTTLAHVAGGGNGSVDRIGQAARTDLGPPIQLTPLPAGGAPMPDEGRLHRSYLAEGYQADSMALSSFRVDPAPADVMPGLSVAEALRSFNATAAASVARQEGTTMVLRFGLFTGNVANPLAPGSNALTGTRELRAEPAWLLLIDGVRSLPSGGGAAAGPSEVGTTGNPPAPGITAAPPKVLVGYAATVIADADGRPLTGMTITGRGSVSQLGLG